MGSWAGICSFRPRDGQSPTSCGDAPCGDLGKEKIWFGGRFVKAGACSTGKTGPAGGKFPTVPKPEPGNQRRRGISRESVDQLGGAGGAVGIRGFAGTLLGIGNDIVLVKISLDILAALRVAGNVKGDKIYYGRKVFSVKVSGATTGSTTV